MVEALVCTSCEHAKAHGWWGHDGTHCRDCHRTWKSHTQAHCAVCHRHFKSDWAALEHHGPHGCVDPATIVTKAGTPRFELRDTPSGPMWGWAGSYEGPTEAGGTTSKAI